MFALQTLYFSFVIYHSYLFQKEFAGVVELNYPFLIYWDIAYFSLAFILVSIALIFLTYYKLYVPEKEHRIQNRRKLWVAFMGVLGCFFGLIIGGLIFAYAYAKLEEQTHSSEVDTEKKEIA